VIGKSGRGWAALVAITLMLQSAMVLMVPDNAAASPATWTVSPSPDQPGPNTAGVAGVSCPSTLFCMAVGDRQSDADVDGFGSFAEQWDGARWSVVPTPNPRGDAAVLSSVSCTSSAFCAAVGSRFVNPNSDRTQLGVAEMWDGGSWSMMGNAKAGVSQTLSSVSCGSPIFCVAVGHYATSNGHGRSLIEDWSGGSWSVVSNPQAGNGTDLSGVSCVSALLCTAVGYDNPKRGRTDTLIESWNGAAWSVVSSPNGTSGTSLLVAVSCASAAACMAVGTFDGTEAGYLAETWNGSSWSVVPSATVGTEDDLFGVSCPSPGFCSAVGQYYDGTVYRTLTEEWDGSVWSVVPDPNPEGKIAEFDGVSCVSSEACSAVGGDEPVGKPAGAYAVLIEGWNGVDWSATTSRDPSGFADALSGVSCGTAASCAAVGSYTDPDGVARAQIATWNGISWTAVSIPKEGVGDYLTGVSCVAASFCAAVGYYTGSGSGVSWPLVEMWDGSGWSNVPGPDTGTDKGQLVGVSCLSPISCTAVGSFVSQGSTEGLVASWDGTSWSVVPSSVENTLSDISCVSATSCTAVGGLFGAIVETWDGSTWSTIPSPDPGDSVDLNGVSCVSATSCTAVGNSISGGISQTFVETWDGASWTVTPSPNSGTSANNLDSVSCTSSTSCDAVGTFVNDQGVSQPLVEAWGGSTWSIVTAPDPGAAGSVLSAISCPISSTCSAVGHDDTTYDSFNLVEQYG
jgi:hypothetical protein